MIPNQAFNFFELVAELLCGSLFSVIGGDGMGDLGLGRGKRGGGGGVIYIMGFRIRCKAKSELQDQIKKNIDAKEQFDYDV